MQQQVKRCLCAVALVVVLGAPAASASPAGLWQAAGWWSGAWAWVVNLWDKTTTGGSEPSNPPFAGGDNTDSGPAIDELG